MNSTPEEKKDNERLSKAAKFVEHCRAVHADALRSLADARQQLDRAREKHHTLFLECERRAVIRAKELLK